MELRVLRYFLIVAREENITKAANLLHVTLKLVDPSSSLVLAAHDYTLPLNRQVKSLLRTR